MNDASLIPNFNLDLEQPLQRRRSRAKPYDDFRRYAPEEMWRFTASCERIGLLHFPLGVSALKYLLDSAVILLNSRQIVGYAVAHGWAKYPDPNAAPPLQPSKRWCQVPGKYNHSYNHLGVCNHCGQPRTRAPRSPKKITPETLPVEHLTT